VILLTVVGLWLLYCAIGVGIASLVLPITWRRERVMLAPAFGAAVIILFASTLSYLGMSMQRAAPLANMLALAVSATGARRAWEARHLDARHWKATLLVNALGFAAAASAVLSVLLYHAWSPYNDAFTYISIADHLQGHSYFEPSIPTATEPLLTQIWLYKTVGLRMGSSFLLAFATALFKGSYSFDFYLPVLATALWASVPAFWVFCRRVLILSHRACMFAACVYALHVGITVGNALEGFQPQAWGTTFFFSYLTLHVRAADGRWRSRLMVAAGLFGAMLLLTYSEFVPFALVAAGSCYLSRIYFGRLRLSRAIVPGVVPILMSAAVTPVAALNFLPSVRIQFGAVVGADLPLGLFDYVGLLSGYRSMTRSILMSPGLAGLACRLASIAAVTTATYAVFQLRARTTRQMMFVGAVFVAAVLWFSVGAANPWREGQIGQPWSTYKAVTYAFFLFAALWGAGLAALLAGSRLQRVLALGQLAALIVFFTAASIVTARLISQEVRTFTGDVADPIVEYKRIGTLVARTPANQPVNLLIPDSAWRHRQIVAYFLRRPVVADWSRDPYIGTYLPKSGHNQQLDPQFPTLALVPPGTPDSVARLQLLDTTSIVDTTFGDGWYVEERDKSDWWRWVYEHGTMSVRVRRPGWLSMTTDLAIIGASARNVSITFAEAPDKNRSFQVPGQWFTPFTVDRIHVEAGLYQITIAADGPAIPGNETDPRLLRFAVRNLRWTLEPD
jgi:hypothetical protein